MIGLTQSLDFGNREIVVHVRNLPDFRFRARSLEERNEIIESIGEAYIGSLQQSLLTYGVAGGLAAYTTTERDLMNQLDSKKPSDDFLLREVNLKEDIPSRRNSPKQTSSKASIGASSSGTFSTGASDDSSFSDESYQLDNRKPSLFAKGGDKETCLADFAIKK